MSGTNLEAFEKTEVDAFVATGRENKKDSSLLKDSNREIKKPDFSYDSERDCFTCPAGQALEQRARRKRIYQAEKVACRQCSHRQRCCKSKKRDPRTIHTDDKEPLRQAMVEKMERRSSKQIYGKRKVIVEPVFGQIKNSGFRGVLLRGHKKANGEFSLVCAAHNFKKIAGAIRRGEMCLRAVKMGAMAA